MTLGWVVEEASVRSRKLVAAQDGGACPAKAPAGKAGGGWFGRELCVLGVRRGVRGSGPWTRTPQCQGEAFSS